MEYGLIGHPLRHSFSPEIHRLCGESFKAPYDYVLNDIEDDDALKRFLTEKRFKAVNVTIPYKQKVIPFLDWISPQAASIGAVNLIVNDNGTLKGYNTDYYGLKDLLEASSISPSGKNCLILGHGGTSKTAKALLSDSGASKIIFASRHPGGENELSYQEVSSRGTEFQLIVNTTPSGMFPHNDQQPIDLGAFPNLEGVADAIFNPLQSNLILQAKKLGIKASGGLRMLVAQAVYAASIFLDKPIEDGVIESIYSHCLNQKSNIVLIGMPTSGKTTLGKRLSAESGRPFYDVDEMIGKKTGLSASDYIKSHGEASFRDVESQVIAELAPLSGVVIATGGGSILREENLRRLRQNGILYFLNRPLSQLKAKSDRPLSADIESLKKRYQERLPLYKAAADVTINGRLTLERKCKLILGDKK